MLSVENNELLTRVGSGTPMGTLMRYYWQPVCAMDALLRSPFRAKEVKVLGEELVVKVFQSCGYATLSQTKRHPKRSEGSDDDPSAALSLL